MICGRDLPPSKLGAILSVLECPFYWSVASDFVPELCHDEKSIFMKMFIEIDSLIIKLC